jgi:uncharacterized membrane protein
MSTEILASSSINAFGLPGQVQPSDQLIILPLGRLQDIITQAVQEATELILQELHALGARQEALESRISSREVQQSSEPEIEALKSILEARDEEVRALKGELETLEESTARERAYDRQRISKLEQKEPQPLQKDRGEILRALIAANGGKMLAKDARKMMRLSKQTFSMLLASMSEYIETKPLHSDKRKDVLILK